MRALSPRGFLPGGASGSGSDWSEVDVSGRGPLASIDGSTDPIGNDAVGTSNQREFISIAAVAANTGAGPQPHVIRAYFANHFDGVNVTNTAQTPVVDCWRWTGSTWRTPRGTTTSAHAVIDSGNMP